MRSFPFLLIGTLVGILAIRRFGRDAIEIATGLALPLLFLVAFLREKLTLFSKKRSRPT